KDAAEDAKVTVEGAVEDAVEEGKEIVEEGKEAVEDVVEDAKDAAEDAKDAVEGAVEDAVEEGKEIVEEGKEAVEDVVEEAKDAAEDAKDAVEGVVEDAKDAAENLIGEVSEAGNLDELVDAVKQEAGIEDAAEEVTVTFSTGETATAIVGQPFEFFFQCDAPGDMGEPAEGEEGAGIVASSGEVTYENVSLGGPFSYPTSEKVIVTGFEGDFEITVADAATQMEATHTIYFTAEDIEAAVAKAEQMEAERANSEGGESPEGESPEGEAPAAPEGESPEGEAPAAPEGESPEGESPEGESPAAEAPAEEAAVAEESAEAGYHSVIQDILNNMNNKEEAAEEAPAATGKINAFPNSNLGAAAEETIEAAAEAVEEAAEEAVEEAEASAQKINAFPGKVIGD
ncbi:MAG: hypothetical protein IJ106_11805, partial [Parasporobacterium sp.]|nr:hypothetical protein [Parasporobacterium sp.]